MAEMKSSRVKDNLFSKFDRENEMAFVASSTSVVYQKSLRYSAYIAEGCLVRAEPMQLFERNAMILSPYLKLTLDEGERYWVYEEVGSDAIAVTCLLF
ncbi:hypothetical protein Tco_0625654 [Tanacetum coccineum]|uniref:Uncharacterized protein n=1 Tax=Tanacetum coccineum TaxID=301880 RepID=A0ABQ4WHC5_9ASTR